MKHRILVVEDDLLSRELLCDWLETEGYEVSSAGDLSGAMTAIQAAKPELVFLDVKLGHQDGLELAAWIREDSQLCHIPVVVVTAHAMVTEKDRILQAGCAAFISKPVDFGQIQEHLSRFLRP